MSRAASVNGKVATAQGDVTVSLEAGRGSQAAVATLNMDGPGKTVQLTSVTRLGSAIDADGTQVTATKNSLQIDAVGTFNSQPAKFRIQVTDNGNNNGFFSLTCTSGCSLSISGNLQSGGSLAVANVKS
jgi:hypothetical protein